MQHHVHIPRTGIWVTLIKVSQENYVKDDCQRNCSEPETPYDSFVPFGLTNDRIEDHPDQQAHKETTDMCYTLREIDGLLGE